MKKIVIIFLASMSSMCHGSKLEHWQHPEVEGSIQPNALRSASRNPKLFFGVSVISKVCQKCTQIKKETKGEFPNSNLERKSS